MSDAELITLEVSETLDGQRIDRVISIALEVSRSMANELLAAGLVTIAGRVVTKPSIRVEIGQVVELPPEPAPTDLQPDPSVVLDVVFADDDVLVVNKPAGLVVHPGAGVSTGTLVQGVLAAYPHVAGIGERDRPGIVHRLDKGTSGLLMVALSERAYGSLTDQLRSRSVGREYRALVHGLPQSNEGIVDAPIGRSLRHPTRQTVRADGKPARTSYEVLERFEAADVTLMKFVLETGRTHQIRVHADAIEHPLVGDDRYGSVPTPESVGSVERPLLHAGYLGFEHPGSLEWVEFDSDLPEDFSSVLARLESIPAGE